LLLDICSVNNYRTIHKLKMNRIGLNQKHSEELINQLNDLLSNYQIYYMNIRGFHWNIKGDNFFELLERFEELYSDLFLKVDELAERVLTIGGKPVHAYTEYLKQSEITEATDLSDAQSTVNSLLSGFDILLRRQRKILELSTNANDEGTAKLMGDYIREQEKLVWMYSSFIG